MSNMTEVTQKKKEEFLEAFSKSLGVVLTACKRVNLSRNTIYRWKDEDEEFKRRFEEILEEQKDFVESKFLQNIGSGNAQAQIFYLKTKCKERGYIERTEVTGAEGSPLIPQRMSDEELKAEIERLKNVGQEK